MRRMNTRAHGLKQWLPSWTIPCLMYAEEIRWLLRSTYIKSHMAFPLDPCLNLWSVLGTDRSTNFTRDQSTSDTLRIEEYQAKPAISNELSHIMFACEHNRVFRCAREPRRMPEATMKRLRRKGRFVGAYLSTHTEVLLAASLCEC